MTAKEKANKIANAMVRRSVFDMTNDELKTERIHAKEHGMYLVDEIIEELKGFDTMDGYSFSRIDFWSDVKSELILLTT